MRLRQTYHILLTCFAFLFLALQGTAFAHAAQYGDENHDHNGVACSILTVSSEQDDVPLLSVDTAFLEPSAVEIYNVLFVSTYVRTVQGRAPPGRSPPAYS